MWVKTHSAVVRDVTPAQIWQVWSDISRRHLWDLDTEWAKITGPFVPGAKFQMKVKNGPVIDMEIADCEINRSFTDTCKFFLARLYGVHTLEQINGELHLTTTIKIVGPLGFLWRKLVGESVAAGVPEQTQELLKLAREQA